MENFTRAHFMANRICCCKYNRYIRTVSLRDYAMELIERAAPFVHINKKKKKRKADTSGYESVRRRGMKSPIPSGPQI